MRDKAYKGDVPDVKFWIYWSTLILGVKSALNQIVPFVDTTGSLQSKTVKSVFGMLPVEQGIEW
jgi:hypothetical protein